MLRPMTLRPLALAACLTVLAGCTTTVEPQTPATDRGANAGTEATETSERDGMAELVERLGLTSTQQEKIEAIRDRLVERTRSADAQRLAFQDAIVGAIDACDSDYARLRIEGRRMIDSGNGAKPAILDAINEFHAVLTPEQRKRLIEPMLERSAERRERTDDEGFAAMGSKLDLGIGQILKMAKRARTRITLSRSDRDELRDRFEESAERFMGPRFDAHTEPLAQEPLVEHVVQFIFDLAAVVLPVLEERQCDVAADFARERLADDGAEDSKTK